VSSFDTLLVDLGMRHRPGTGSRYEATDLLLRRRPIQNDVTCVIWQPDGRRRPDVYRAEAYTAEQFGRCRSTCSASTRPEHEVAIVTTRTFPLTRSLVQRLPLRELAVELRARERGDALRPAARRSGRSRTPTCSR
jgi:hypothetical protein